MGKSNVDDSTVPVSTGAGDSALGASQRASGRVALDGRFSASAEVTVTPGGLLAIGAMVTAILLGSAVIVRAARRPYRHGIAAD